MEETDAQSRFYGLLAQVVGTAKSALLAVMDRRNLAITII